MSIRRTSAIVLSIVGLLTPLGPVMAESPKTEIQGAEILKHPCGKVAVKHMGLVHAGKMDEATKLGTQEMQDQWKAMPAEDRKMMSGMMKEMSKSEADFSAEIKAGGLLVVAGDGATLTVKREHRDANGTSTDTLTQRYALAGDVCRITR